jgi:hypothetical protein
MKKLSYHFYPPKSPQMDFQKKQLSFNKKGVSHETPNLLS